MGVAPPTAELAVDSQPRPRHRGPPLNQIYALPAPIRTFPLPSFYPNNPISLVHLVYSWIKQVLSPPLAEPSIIHTGIWDPNSRSVHITDPAAVRALWEQGFYGKGNLSRSEPNWLKREQIRRGAVEGDVSEQRTALRREERRQVKWERARTEQEALERTRREEALLKASDGEKPSAPAVQPALLGPDVELELPTSKAESRSASDQATLPHFSLEETIGKLDTPPNGIAKGRFAHEPPSARNAVISKPLLSKPPVGPLELLALPNSAHELQPKSNAARSTVSKSPVGPLELLALPNALSALRSDPNTPSQTKDLVVNGSIDGIEPHQGSNAQYGRSNIMSRPQLEKEDDAGDVSPRTDNNTHVNGHINSPIFGTIATDLTMSEIPGSKHTLAMPDTAEEQPSKRRKSVRFSTTVKSTTFLDCDPPSPDRSVLVAKSILAPIEASAPEKKQNGKTSVSPISAETAFVSNVTANIENKEHLQLSAEEAFFLAYGIGALSILDPDSNMPIPREKLLGLFRSHSYFPPRQELQASDPFLVHYVVYHHFRSLGWVPRHGIKFGVDWMLYTRGPVFDHAEFGLIVMPSYSHSWWKENGKEAPRKSWHWLHGVNRVLSHVLKSLVLVYVDVPPPHIFDAAMAAGGISAALKEYKVREFMVRRWSSNRNR
ncbi:hypothetical protein BR93DRAFT_948368 [Coniochaeta sp. PMI_546]|nr:hypothetical protein BR93DRAFT_948368 [Coniochaeta sp. PMI_546]